MLRPDELVTKVKEKFGDSILLSEVRERKDGGVVLHEQRQLFLKVERKDFVNLIKFLHKIFPLHMSCPMPFMEKEEVIELIYPFTMFSGSGNLKEMPLIVSLDIPKDDLKVPTLTGIIPGIIVMERETREMLGIEVENLPDQRRFFTADNLKPGFLPMRDSSREVNNE